ETASVLQKCVDAKCGGAGEPEDGVWLHSPVIPLPVDFDVFEPGNPMGLQQALSLPDNCICWIGASVAAAGEIKGWPTFLQIARLNPDLNFVALFKHAAPPYGPPNMRLLTRLKHSELVKVIGACRVGICTSKIESQHLAGIEMGACGLPMVAPPVGVYWQRDDMPGIVVDEATPEAYATAIRAALGNTGDPQATRSYWEKEFSPDVVRAKWAELIKEVES
ncbi:MAG: glycosyltransferase, partial [Planctomycetota bacterium]